MPRCAKYCRLRGGHRVVAPEDVLLDRDDAVGARRRVVDGAERRRVRVAARMSVRRAPRSACGRRIRVPEPGGTGRRARGHAVDARLPVSATASRAHVDLSFVRCARGRTRHAMPISLTRISSPAITCSWWLPHAGHASPNRASATCRPHGMHHATPGVATISSAAPSATVPRATASKQNRSACGSTCASAPSSTQTVLHARRRAARRGVRDDPHHALRERHLMHGRSRRGTRRTDRANARRAARGAAGPPGRSVVVPVSPRTSAPSGWKFHSVGATIR